MPQNILSEGTYTYIAMGVSLVLIVSIMTLLISIFSRIMPIENGARYVEAKQYKDTPEAKKFYRRKKQGITISSLIIASMIGLIIAGIVSGEVEAQSDLVRENTAEAIKEEIREIGSINLSDEQYESLSNGNTAEVEIVLPSGAKGTASIVYRFNLSCFCEQLQVDNEIDGFSEELKEYPSKLGTQMIVQEFYDLQDKYGIHLTRDDISNLQKPYSKPKTLTTYGTVNLTVAEADGNYYNGPVTLIWDDGLKLIKSSNTDGTFRELENPSTK